MLTEDFVFKIVAPLKRIKSALLNRLLGSLNPSTDFL